jgi:tRNA modification GTPase
MDTIFALASARGKAGVAVVRISGPRARQAGESLCGTLPEARRSYVRKVRSGQDILDEALIIRFDHGQSFTGEEVVELHLHGSQAIVGAVLGVLSAMTGLRQAEAGEFTRRALENGRLDLAQVEGLADLIEAETEAQRIQAQRVFSGELGRKADRWRAGLVRAMALLAATIDFADEDVPVDVGPEVLGLLRDVREELVAESRGSKISERIRDGFEVAIVGAPNAGKSTLLNRLAGREAALTSEVAGTTRDIIEVRMDIAGLPVTLLDTAGLRDSQDVVEAMGIERAILRSRDADLRVFLLSVEDEALPVEAREGDILAYGKSDLKAATKGFSLSSVTGEGVDELIDRIGRELSLRVQGAATATRLRHRVAIDQAISRLDVAENRVIANPDSAELAAEDLRIAVRALDSLIGKVDVEDLLDEVFASFCIGK